MPNWKKVIVSGSDASLNSLYVANSVTASIFSGSFTGSLFGTSSYALDSNLLDGKDSTEFATTGSNIFKGLQTIDGNLFMSGAFRLIYNNDATNNMLFGMFDGSNIYGPYYQLFGNQYPNVTQRGSAEFVYDNRNGGESGFNIASFNGSTWTRKFRVDDNGVQITGSLQVTNGITGSLFGTASHAVTSSYITASNVFGPFGSNSVISSSYAVSASHAPNALTASYAISASQAISSSYALSSSYAFNATSASYAFNATSASYTLSSSYAATASSALNASDILIYVKNSSGAQINKGTVVRISGAVGDNPLIETASYINDNNSANTLGITNEDIPNDSFGYVMTEGKLLGIDTSTFTVGQLLYLGATGSIIGTAPVAPLHAVRLGEVLRVQQNNGSMYVRIDNGYELGELHDVVDSTTTSSYGDLLVKSGSVWINSKQLTGSYGLTGSLVANQIYATSLTSSNLQVLNSITASSISATSASFGYLQSVTGSAVIIGQEYIILNTQIPAARYAGLIIYDSGSNNTASVVWDSLTNHFVYQNEAGATYSGGGFLAGPRNTGSLADITYPTQYRVIRSQGDDHLYDSNIIDNDIAVKIGINTEITGSLVVTNVITGSLFGTASWAQNAVTSSYILNAVSASFAQTASLAFTSSFVTASNVFGPFGSNSVTSASFAVSSSYAFNATTASYALTSSNVEGGNQFYVPLWNTNTSLSSSYLRQSGSILKTVYNNADKGLTLDYNTDSFILGNAGVGNNTYLQVFDGGSVININTPNYTYFYEKVGVRIIPTNPGLAVSGVLEVTGPSTSKFMNSNVEITGSLKVTDGITGSLFGTASQAITSSFITSSNVFGPYGSDSITSASYAFSASHAPTSVTASYAISASQAISSSYALSSSYAFNATSASYAISSSQATTASYAIFALSASNAPGFTTNFTQSPAAATWSFNHNLNTRNPLVQVYDTNYQQIVPNEIVGIDAFTVEIRFDYAQAGYAVASNGGGLYVTGSTPRLVQNVAAVTWSFAHNLGTKYPGFEVYDSNDNVVTPAGIHSVDANNAEIYFAYATTGVAIANFSGISGSLDNAISASYATYAVTASYSDAFYLDQTLTDTATIASSANGSNTVFNQATGSYTSAFFKYTVASGSNARSGEVMSVWNGASAQFTDTSTVDIGTTSAVTSSVIISGANVQFNVQTNTAGWKIKSIGTFM